ncbi:MAG: pyridoxal phosphate-dependent aminotransferase [Acidobacteria bacterium]|nr:pyridoxal phosphate-dependent aminotransferase [Acidobacteriota bacterium]
MRLTDRMQRLGTETAFEVFARAQALERQGRDVVHLELGEPDFQSPDSAVEAVAAALRGGMTKYTTSPGLLELRAKIAEVEGPRRGLRFAPEQVVVTPGAKPIMFYVILALAQEGDEVLYPDPGFPIYESMIRFAGATAVPYPLREENGFCMDPDYVASRLSPRTRLVIISSPNNPTGGVERRENLARLASVLREHDTWILSDEIYSHFIFEGSHHSIASFESAHEKTVVLDGFSKTYSMTGWRLGWGIMPQELVPHITRLIINSVSCTSGFVQKGGLGAISTREKTVPPMLAEYRRRRETIVSGLNQIPGVRCALPKGTFYAFPNVSSFGKKSRDVANYLLEEAGVACLSGTAFGNEGEGYLRLSFATSMDKIRTALDRMHDAFGRFQG